MFLMPKLALKVVPYDHCQKAMLKVLSSHFYYYQYFR